MRLMTSSGGLQLKYRITAGPGAADPEGFERRDIYVECRGPDTWLLLENDGDLLRALEHIAAKMLRLEPEDHDRISFDADGYKAKRARAIRQTAAIAISFVRSTGQPFRFQPMNSRERRMLHLSLQDSCLNSASSGEGAQRFVVLYPPGSSAPPSGDTAPRRPRPRNVDYGNN
jgi:spoIIIJ-associated protein